MKTLDLNTLDLVARAVARAQEASSMAQMLVRSHPDMAAERAAYAKGRATTALEALASLGATIPGIETDAPSTIGALRLDQLDTPVSRRFLEALQVAAEAGAELDRERGWIDHEGAVCGHGETLGAMVLRMEMEIRGPAGRE